MLVAGRRTPARSAASPTIVPPLNGGARVDVCIVGAGLAGMIAAYFLARERRSVMVIDDGPIGGVQAGIEATHLASVVEKPYHLIERLQGREAARRAAHSHAAAIDTLEAIVRRERIACEFERLDGYFLGARGDSDEARRELEAAQRAGIEGVEWLLGSPIVGVDCGPVVRYPAQAQFHPGKLLAGLAAAVRRQGGRIHCGVRSRSIAQGKPGGVLTAAGHRIDAAAIVTSHPVRGDGHLEARPQPRLAHVIGLRVPRGAVTRALYWDSSMPGSCARLRSHGTGAGEVLLVGGEDGSAEGDAKQHYESLEAWARDRFPIAGEVVQRFSGYAIQSLDLFALESRVGSDTECLHVANGDWGTGVTRSTLAGLVVRDFIGRSEVAWAELHMPPDALRRGSLHAFARDLS